MRISLYLILAGFIALAACEKSNETEVRWVEVSQHQEVIVFKTDATPSLPAESATGTQGSFYFQSRKLPDYVSRANESGIYFYAIVGDSLVLKTSQKKVFFKMAADGKSFKIGRFFIDPGGLPDSLLTFKKQ